MRSVAVRAAGVLGAVAALALAWFPFWLTLLTVAVAAQRPDPAVPDGDPCCGHPDTWGEVAGGLAFGLLSGVVTAGLLAGAAACAAVAALGRPPRWTSGRRARRVVTGWAVVLVVALALFLGVP